MRDQEIYDLGNGITAMYLEREELKTLTILNSNTGVVITLPTDALNRLKAIVCEGKEI